MKLSVIIPTYNRVDLLQRAIGSVLTQQLPNGLEPLQVIVVDDGSTDNTAVIMAERFPGIIYIEQSNSGVSAARNRGLREANGEWIALLDSDDEWLPQKLLRQFEMLAESRLLVCHTHEIWIRNGKRVNQMDKHQKRGGWIFEHCLPMCAMSPSSIIIHNSVFNAIGVFDEAFPACEDYDLWLRLTARYSVAYVEQACINKYGGHADQLSHRHWGMDRFRVLALQQILQSDLSLSMRNAATKMLIKKLNILLNGAIKRGNTELIKDCETDLKRAAAIS
ncbi:MAG: glycosyltransferase involved in cell wall biosynthesis [Arenicella sp.]|jgi:glycosyltransferase involved in cell wall biosynthesis